MVPVFIVQHDALNLIALVGCPAEDATIKTGAEELLLVHRLIPRWLPSETCDGEIHILILDLVEAIAEHGGDNLK